MNFQRRRGTMRRHLVIILSLLGLLTLTARGNQFKFPVKSNSVRFAAIGDMGTGGAAQYEVAQQMIAARQTFPLWSVTDPAPSLVELALTPSRVVRKLRRRQAADRTSPRDLVTP